METNSLSHHFIRRLALTLLLMKLLSVSRSDQKSLPSKTDQAALLLFKETIHEDPNGVLSNWKFPTNPCAWNRVACSVHGRVSQLDLADSKLAGTPNFNSLASLVDLSVLRVSDNSFAINSTALLELPSGLTRLEMSSSGVQGPIPEALFSKCPNLITADLSRNNLSGSMPENLLLNNNQLRALDLSFNSLTGSIKGANFGSCSALSELDLSGNTITDVIPASLSNCSNLRTLNLSFNMLTGQIPGWLGRLDCLQRLDLSHNHLSGTIPQELQDACDSLIELKLEYNNISGAIPSLCLCSWLRFLDLSNNNLTFPFPDSMLRGLRSVETLLVSNNFINGSFPPSLSLCKKLRIADFSSNRLSGTIPAGICPGGASSLVELRLADNLIEGEIPASLSQCGGLKTIDLSLNYLNGSIPRELGQLENLEQLIAWFNGLSGEIPAELGNCRRLKDLILNNNRLEGGIPREVLMGCRDLEWIALTSNGLSGEIPKELGLLSRLAVLQLANNSFGGQIPGELARCSSLVWLDLNSNRLAGEIPPRLGRRTGEEALTGILGGNTLVFVRNIGNSCKGVGGLLEFAGIRPERLLLDPNLKTCDFTRMYSGAVLSRFTQYQTLEYLDLSYNQLRGQIPGELGEMVALQVLDLAHNHLSGPLPPSLGNLKNLGVLDVSRNRLQGTIPDTFAKLSFLVQIDLSYNELTGQIPARGQLSTLPATQFGNNPGLCGVPLPKCEEEGDGPTQSALQRRQKGQAGAAAAAHSLALGILISAASLCILLAWAILIRNRVMRREAECAKMLGSLNASQAATTWMIDREKEPLSINVATFQRQLRKVKFSQLIEATDGFSEASLIGCGGFGEVFKATLKDGSRVAIKKLIHLSCQGDREFMAEMETLGKIIHQNLVPLLGYCKVGEERLLVYEFMEFGSLEEMLHSRWTKHQRVLLSWAARKKIARGAAKGLCFLHHNCIPHIIHRDMKSSNVLLDRDMEARVSDFGMARLISALDTHLSVSTLAGTPGYVPPEYYQSFRCTAKGDVYSFGVILLELLTGKRPTDKDDFGDTNLVGWVKMMAREGKGTEVIDAELLLAAAKRELKEMVCNLEIAIKCVDDFPSRRPSMLQVEAMLRDLSPDATDGDGNSSG